MTTKMCNGCSRELPIEDFDLKWKDKERRHGRCRECRRDYQRKYMDEKRRANTVQRNFNITAEEYERMVEEQDNKCAICHKPETARQGGKVKRLAVDHCHETGKVRGLLCQKCNIMIGNAGDNSDYLMSAVMYLRESETCRSRHH